MVIIKTNIYCPMLQPRSRNEGPPRYRNFPAFHWVVCNTLNPLNTASQSNKVTPKLDVWHPARFPDFSCFEHPYISCVTPNGDWPHQTVAGGRHTLARAFTRASMRRANRSLQEARSHIQAKTKLKETAICKSRSQAGHLHGKRAPFYSFYLAVWCCLLIAQCVNPTSA